MSEKIFRVLILSSIASEIVAAVFSFALESSYPTEIKNYLDASYEAALTMRDILLFVIAIPFFVALVWSIVGLYRFKVAGRTTALWLTILSLPLYSFLGISIDSGWEELFMSLSSMLWGAVLCAAYFSPLKSKFESS